MLTLHSFDDKKLIINDPFRELWSILKFRGKYIPLPEQTEQIIKNIPNQKIIVGKLCKDKKFYFNNISDDINIFGNEIQLSIDYDYEIKWKIKSKCKDKINVGFYSPYRKFSSDRLYLNFDKNNKKLTKYKCYKGKILINCHILIIALDKYHLDTDIILTINPIIKNVNKLSCHQIEYCDVKIFDIKKEGIFYRPLIRKEFKKLYNLVREYYEFTSIERSNYQDITKFDLFLLNNKYIYDSLPKEIDYTGVLSKKSYESIFTVTSNIQPISDRIGYYGIVIKRDPNIISSATVYYEFELSNILQTPDVIVAAAYYEGDKGYVLHQIYDKIKNEDVYVMNVHNGPYSDSNIITGQLDLESTAVDITLIIGNSLYGILPTNGRDPNKIIQFKKFDIQYCNIER
jgi:hypothetical protein